MKLHRWTGRLPQPRESTWQTLRTFGRDPLGAPGAYFDSLGETFELSILGSRFILTRDPEWFDEVLVKQAKSFDKDRTTKNLGTLMGQGLLVSDGTRWRERRRLLSPPFLPREVQKQLGLFSRAARQELASWQPGRAIDLHAAMERLTMRIVLGSLFGYESYPNEHFETQMAAAMRYFEGIAGTQVPLPTWVPTGTNRAFVRARADLRALAARLIERPAPEGTVLAKLQGARAEGQLSRQDVLDEVMTLLVAGHETSALSLTYLLGELGLVQELQDPIARDALEFEDPPTLADVTRRGAIQQAVLEGLRLYPVAWAVGREATQDVRVGEQLLQRGTQVGLFQWSMQRSARYFERPLEFWPDRFAERPLSSLPKGVFSPFGLGPRVCVGQQFALAQIAVTLSEVLRAFRIETVSPYPPRLRASITARPRDPVLIRVRPRVAC
jgi:cytochrome P450